MKVLVFLCCLAVAKAGLITTNYSPASSVSTVYSSINSPAPVGTKTITPVTYHAPAPVYESVLSTHESRTKSLDGTQHDTYSKSLNTPYSTLNKFDSRSTNNGILTHSAPTVYSAPTLHSAQIISQPQSYIGTPLVHSVSSPIAYTTHAQTAPVFTKTVSAPAIASYSTPVLANSNEHVKITYSEAPLVSHMTFNGLGTSYSW